MKTIIAGSRSINSYEIVERAIKNSEFEIKEIISGTAEGVDKLGERYAQENGIKLTRMPADWNRFGKRAGYLRNVDMANCAEALILVWDGVSKGSKHMLDIARNKKLSIYMEVI
jgi:hypothetical protein